MVTATALFSDGEFAEAEILVRAFLVRHGHHVEAMRLLARLGIERDALDDAQLLLEGVLDVAPEYDAARFEYAQVLSKRQMHQQAQEQVEKLLAAEPDNRNYRTLHAMTCIGLGQNERAVELYRGLLADAPRPAELHLSIAHSLKTLGQRDAAIAEYRQAASGARGLRRGLLEPREPQDLPLRGPRTCHHARRRGQSPELPRRSLPPVLRARQGARGPRRVRRVLRATTRAATR